MKNTLINKYFTDKSIQLAVMGYLPAGKYCINDEENKDGYKHTSTGIDNIINRLLK